MDFIRYADLFLDRGIAPVAGGALDQSKWFLDGAYQWHAEDERLKRELGVG